MAVAGGLVHAITDPDGVTVRFGYDEHGRLVTAVDAEGGVTRIDRDPAVLPVAMTTAVALRAHPGRAPGGDGGPDRRPRRDPPR